jgi:hypothetical protein
VPGDGKAIARPHGREQDRYANDKVEREILDEGQEPFVERLGHEVLGGRIERRHQRPR